MKNSNKKHATFNLVQLRFARNLNVFVRKAGSESAKGNPPWTPDLSFSGVVGKIAQLLKK